MYYGRSDAGELHCRNIEFLGTYRFYRERTGARFIEYKSLRSGALQTLEFACFRLYFNHYSRSRFIGKAKRWDGCKPSHWYRHWDGVYLFRQGFWNDGRAEFVLALCCNVVSKHPIRNSGHIFTEKCETINCLTTCTCTSLYSFGGSRLCWAH